MRFSTFFFDLDETIYPQSAGLWEMIGNRITQYMIERLGFSPEEVRGMRDRYFLEYGTTLRGLQANHSVDMNDYLAYVHDVPLEQYIHPNPDLPRILGNLKAKKYIFTNADANHANRVLNLLGIRSFFTGIIDVHAIAPFCKPMPESFRMALQIAGNPKPQECALLDDQARVTRAAKSIGMYSILVGKQIIGDEANTSVLNLNEIASLIDCGL